MWFPLISLEEDVFLLKDIEEKISCLFERIFSDSLRFSPTLNVCAVTSGDKALTNREERISFLWT